MDSAAAAPGTVTVESNRKLVQHPDGGVVTRIAVTDGDVVRRNDVLLELDTTESQARFDAVRQSLMAALLSKARLEAERARAEEMQLPKELRTPASDAEAREIEVAFAAERAQFRDRQRSLAGKVAIQNEKIGQLRDQIAGIEAEKRSAERQIAIMRDELVGLRELHEKGYYPRTRILEMERQLAKLGGQVGSADASIASAHPDRGGAPADRAGPPAVRRTGLERPDRHADPGLRTAPALRHGGAPADRRQSQILWDRAQCRRRVREGVRRSESLTRPARDSA
nr:biotin/lipoyl-binding protein [Rhodovibrio sodomensis]